ncbi:PilN domain-containing protein [Rubripirellula obstinata]|uniref:PilN domain-containing protein n=1 Tax=Rubripirellula obstinata TaxID=406547 RepID=UPI00122D16DB|nr:PilN domain-containing protein [Rubripirellula obstinata]
MPSVSRTSHYSINKRKLSPVPQSISEPVLHEPCFGLRIESHVVQAAIALPLADGRRQLSFDEIVCPTESGWLTASGAAELESALETLVERHHMRRHRIAVSLDGDFCVTRVTMGTPDQVDHDLEMLGDRIPRYLQLGPGEKVTGNARGKIDNSMDHSVTGVVNRSLIQIIYDAFRSIDVDVAWVEPSLVSIARLAGQDKAFDERPVLIADGMGKQWDVGIACAGRLLLDYRPAAANNNEGFCKVLEGHYERLKRFCSRHRGVVTDELHDLLICGDEEKTQDVLQRLSHSSRVNTSRLQIPMLPNLYEVSPADQLTRNVPAVATVYPLLVGTKLEDVADLLEQVRRAPDLSLGQKVLKQCWPIAVAAVCLVISYGLVSSERRRHAGSDGGRAALQAEIIATSVKQSRISHDRQELDYLIRIANLTQEPRWDQMFDRITKMLPPSVKLNEFRVDSGSAILMEGTTVDETMIYELVNSLRHLPSVSQVALKGTTPNSEDQSTRFTVQLKTVETTTTAGASVASKFGSEESGGVQ